MSCYAIKLGDQDPPLLATLLGADELPADLTAVSELKIAVRRSGESEFALERDAAIVDIDHQLVTDETRGQVRVLWDAGEIEALGVGEMEAEFQAIRDGRRVSWPSAGYVPFTIWQDIVPDEGS
jgi:hypothetical protein